MQYRTRFPVRVDLARGVVIGPGRDTTRNIELIFGSNHGDVLIGSHLDNYIDGSKGDDVIRGKGGEDQLDGNFGDDILSGGAGRDSIVDPDGYDRVWGGRGRDRCDADRLTGCRDLWP